MVRAAVGPVADDDWVSEVQAIADQDGLRVAIRDLGQAVLVFDPNWLGAGV